MERDIVERLREGAYTDSLDDALMKEAADLIEQLRLVAGSVSMLDKGFREITKDLKRSEPPTPA